MSESASSHPAEVSGGGEAAAASTAMAAVSLRERGAAVPEGDHDSGVDETTQRGGGGSPKSSSARRPPSRPGGARTPGGSAQKRSQSVPKPFSTYGTPKSAEKRVPMNKIKVGMSDSPNLKQVRSKIGSLNNATYRPGGGEVKIESRKLEWKAGAKTQAKNEGYSPKGGEIKIESHKLTWNAQSKIGSLENTKHKAGGGEKKIASQKLNWKADSKVGSKDYIHHKPGGGQVKIVTQKVEVVATSKVGSLSNAKHTPGGGDKKVFNDVEYLRQKSASSTVTSAGPASKNTSRRQSASQLNTSDTLESVDSCVGASVSPKSNDYSSQMKRKMTPEPPPLSAPANALNIDV